MSVARLGRLSVRVRRRSVAVVAVLLAVTAAVGVAAVLSGEYTSTPAQALDALLGRGDVLAQVFVREVRLPRALAAVVVGAALGASGAIFQAISGNPLGSPDIIGFTVGAATGAVTTIVLFGGTPAQVAVGALAGGSATAALVYLLARRDGGVAGPRLVLVGVGVGAVLSAVNSLLLVRSSLAAAQTAAVWLAGSLNAMSWATVTVAGSAGVLLCVLATLLSRPLGLLVMGDELAGGLGIRPQGVRAASIGVGVALVSLATAIAGPIAFVALAAPQLARRLTRSPGPAVTASMAMGAALVLCCDQVAQRLFAPVQLPVGVVTGSLGGAYMIWLLTREVRQRRR
ncbi:iron chelate uptake ABC transporter family permease subunit [Phytohabitans sp. ZYX-F-186]|uniref:Iron chelate uptake ABC transporter family permease subunit n=1 Tax=Phytohabitans maris TaxID=3071409 RepID=A0ABU0Z950_9ACTN|nr:iron chelate uptake ABC transporter family permease subunit [Phytohabitans sp. ZYX-F-186]MDQ7903580.1 iron chelate uptake ABC transporter family permease subunit [Phytohabitans sp. ZYX-F-186]